MNNDRMETELEKIAQHGVPEDINLWPNISAQLEGKTQMMTPRTRPLMAVLITTLTLLVLSGAAYALGKTLGYFPGIGLVENSAGIRVLAKPVSLTREGVTLTISNAFVYTDRVELIYDFVGIQPENNAANAGDAQSNPAAFCGGANDGESPNKHAEARLQLPDGTQLERDASSRYPQNRFALKPVYAVSLPGNVMNLKLVLDCIPGTKLGTVPENWAVPFELTTVPAGIVVGAPVIEVNATSQPVAIRPTATPTTILEQTRIETIEPTIVPVSPLLAFSLENVVQTATGPIFYIRLSVKNPDPAILSVIPGNVYIVDTLGQKIQLINNTINPENSSIVWEYSSTTKPADGALTLVVEDAYVKYSGKHDTSFTFDVGNNPQPGQLWELNQIVNIAGYDVKIQTARAVTFADIQDNPESWDPAGGPDYPEGSQGYDNGYQFSVDLGSTISNVNIYIPSDSCWLTDFRQSDQPTVILWTQLCRDGYPKNKVNVVIDEVSVLVKNVGQVAWKP